jgi:CheY-like chemotaxis protein
MTAGALRQGTVLIVEDEPSVRELVVAALADLGFSPLAAADGLAGLKILRAAQKIDLLIADIGLPGMNGRELVTEARSLRPGLKVLFMTGYPETGAPLEPGMEMIIKPFSHDTLATQIGDLLEG